MPILFPFLTMRDLRFSLATHILEPKNISCLCQPQLDTSVFVLTTTVIRTNILSTSPKSLRREKKQPLITKKLLQISSVNFFIVSFQIWNGRLTFQWLSSRKLFFCYGPHVLCLVPEIKLAPSKQLLLIRKC